MKEYAVYTTNKFNKEFSKLDKSHQDIIYKIFYQLKENPCVGDSLRYRFLREKRIKGKRIYYLVYDDLLAVLVVAISDKKTQQETINYIVKYLNYYREYITKLIMDN